MSDDHERYLQDHQQWFTYRPDLTDEAMDYLTRQRTRLEPGAPLTPAMLLLVECVEPLAVHEGDELVLTDAGTRVACRLRLPLEY